MCGICGKLNVGSHAPRVTEESIHRMLSPISHRGPDAEGVFISDSLGLGHKRLKIIDLVTGKQPMCNENGTVWITFSSRRDTSLRVQVTRKS
jgi:asparagine synthase (glutamine-hydrolysing)